MCDSDHQSVALAWGRQAGRQASSFSRHLDVENPHANASWIRPNCLESALDLISGEKNSVLADFQNRR